MNDKIDRFAVNDVRFDKKGCIGFKLKFKILPF